MKKIKFILLISVLLMLASAGFSATRFVNDTAGGPPNYSTLYSAITNSASGDIVILEKNVTESITYNKSGITIQSGAGGPYTWNATGSGASGSNLYSNIAACGITVNDVIFTHTSGSGWAVYQDVNVSESWVFNHCVFSLSGGTSADIIYIYRNGGNFDTNSFQLYRCIVDGLGVNNGIKISGNADQALVLENSIIQNCNGATGYGIYKTGSTRTLSSQIRNCTFYNNKYAIYDEVGDSQTGTASYINNSLFLSNTNDLYYTVAANFNRVKAVTFNCAFGAQGADATLTANGCLYNSVLLQEVISASDMHLLATSVNAKNNGRTTYAPHFDFDGLVRPAETFYDIGAFEYGASSATITQTPSQTPTSTPTLTITETSTQTSTCTDTQTVTQTDTQTITQTITETVTQTATGTDTQTVTETETQTVTQTATETITQTVTQTDTQTVTETQTQTVTQTDTATITQTQTETVTETATQTNTQTQTQTVTQTTTASVTATVTQTDTQTSSPTVTETATETVTQTMTGTITQTDTATQTVTETVTETLTSTNTPVFTLTVTPTETATLIPSPTETDKPSVTKNLIQPGDVVRITGIKGPQNTKVELIIYSASGRIIKKAEYRDKNAIIQWDGAGAESGVYGIRVKCGNEITVLRVAVLR